MTVGLAGSCNCGGLRFEANGEPVFQGFCQCLECRKSGSGHSAAITMKRGDVTISGEFRSYERTGDSGSIVTGNFCPTCGVLVFNEYPDAGAVISINAALLDDPKMFHPEIVLYARSALPWDYIDPELPRSDAAPPARSS